MSACSVRKDTWVISPSQLPALLRAHHIGVSAPEVLLELPEGPIFHLRIAGGSYALDQWQTARNLVPTTGLWPVIVNSSGMEGFLFADIQREDPLPQLIRQAQDVHALDVLAKRLHRSSEFVLVKSSEQVSVAVFSATDPSAYLPWIERIRGVWPDIIDPEDSDPHDFLLPEEFLQIPKGQEMVTLCLLPIEQSWEVPLCLQFGGWNECPLPAEHSSVQLSWQQRYGAEIVCMSGDIIECIVTSPPTTQREARTLALEQFAYCSDIVHQGVGSLEELAARLLRNQTWYFWWD